MTWRPGLLFSALRCPAGGRACPAQKGCRELDRLHKPIVRTLLPPLLVIKWREGFQLWFAP